MRCSRFSPKKKPTWKGNFTECFIGNYHGQLVLEALEWHIEPNTVDFIASHGQTIYHAPKRLHHQAIIPTPPCKLAMATTWR
jgi:anhydro-N-acetylmuramic acid kinase